MGRQMQTTVGHYRDTEGSQTDGGRFPGVAFSEYGQADCY